MRTRPRVRREFGFPIRARRGLVWSGRRNAVAHAKIRQRIGRVGWGWFELGGGGHAPMRQRLRLGRIILVFDRRRCCARAQPALLRRGPLGSGRTGPADRNKTAARATWFVSMRIIGIGFARARLGCRLARNLFDFGNGATQPRRSWSARGARWARSRVRAGFAAAIVGGQTGSHLAVAVRA